MLIRRMVSSFRGISSRDVKKSIREETALERSIWILKMPIVEEVSRV